MKQNFIFTFVPQSGTRYMIKANAITLNIPRITRITFNLKFLGILGCILIFSLLVFYIFQVYETTRAGFSLSNFEQQSKELAETNKDLQIRYSQTNSLVNLETTLRQLNYEKVDKIQYVRISASTVVAR